MSAKQYAVALGCLQFLAKMGQVIPEGKQPAPKSLTQINLNNMSAKQLGAYLRESLGEIPAEQRRAMLAAIPELASIPEDPEPGA